jgi:hypothetical protein
MAHGSQVMDKQAEPFTIGAGMLAIWKAYMLYAAAMAAKDLATKDLPGVYKSVKAGDTKAATGHGLRAALNTLFVLPGAGQVAKTSKLLKAGKGFHPFLGSVALKGQAAQPAVKAATKHMAAQVGQRWWNPWSWGEGSKALLAGKKAGAMELATSPNFAVPGQTADQTFRALRAYQRAAATVARRSAGAGSFGQSVPVLGAALRSWPAKQLGTLPGYYAGSAVANRLAPLDQPPGQAQDSAVASMPRRISRPAPGAYDAWKASLAKPYVAKAPAASAYDAWKAGLTGSYAPRSDTAYDEWRKSLSKA